MKLSVLQQHDFLQYLLSVHFSFLVLDLRGEY